MDVGRPVEILDKMIDLERWWESSAGQAYGEGFITSMIKAEEYPALYSNPPTFNLHQAHYLQRSLPYFVTDQMVDKIWDFSKRFETVGFYAEELPNDNGFMWLAKPVHTLDANGEIQCNRAITWVKQDDGVGICFYSDRNDIFDEVNVKLRADLGEKRFREVYPELSLNHVQGVAWGDRTQFFNPDPVSYAAKYKNPMGKAYDPEKIKLGYQEHYTLCRFLLACWEWMGYQLPSHALPHRQMARRLGRSNLDAREVLVIDLQAIEQSHIPPATHQVVRWHYRFRSRPHKRHWVDKNGNHRVTDVVGCIKPQAPEYEDLPLIERDILFKMRRGHAPI